MKSITISKVINQHTDTIFELISTTGIPSRSNNTVVKHVPVMDPNQVGKDFFVVTPSMMEQKLIDWKLNMVTEDGAERPVEIGKVDTTYELCDRGESTVIKYTICYEVKSSLMGSINNALVLSRLMKKIARKNLDGLEMKLNKGKTALAA